MDSPEVTFTLAYLVFAVCFVFTPTEFHSAGLTVQNLLSGWLGSEDAAFVPYHLRRTSATLLCHSLLPLGEQAGPSPWRALLGGRKRPPRARGRVPGPRGRLGPWSLPNLWSGVGGARTRGHSEPWLWAHRLCLSRPLLPGAERKVLAAAVRL